MAVKPWWMPESDWQLVQEYADRYGLDPNLVAAIGWHETKWGQAGAGKQGYILGVGVYSSGTPNPAYKGLEAQLAWAVPRLAGWFRGVPVTAERLTEFARQAWRPDDPTSWAQGVLRSYWSMASPIAQEFQEPQGPSFWQDPGGWLRANIFTDQVILFVVGLILVLIAIWGMMR